VHAKDPTDVVIPAKAGISCLFIPFVRPDAGFRRHDGQKWIGLSNDDPFFYSGVTKKTYFQHLFIRQKSPRSGFSFDL
jgi:hypothetical protein